MDLIMILLVVAVIGAFAWFLITYVPMPAPFQTVIVLIAVLFIILFLLRRLGGIPNVL